MAYYPGPAWPGQVNAALRQVKIDVHWPSARQSYI